MTEIMTTEEVEIAELKAFVCEVTRAAALLARQTLSAKDHGQIVTSLTHALRCVRIAAPVLESEYVRNAQKDLMDMMTLHVTCARIEKLFAEFDMAYRAKRPISVKERRRIHTYVEIHRLSLPAHIARTYTARLAKYERQHLMIPGSDRILLFVPKHGKPLSACR